MTRRKIYFFDKENKKLYSTPEFNGDKSEFNLFSKRGDSCDKDFNEILREFEKIKTLEEFRGASDKAQNYYHSGFVGTVTLPIEEVSKITYNDEIYMLDNNGNPYLYNPSELTREYVLDMCNRGKFICKDLIMSVIKLKNDDVKYDIYILNIEPIENIYSGLKLYLGDFSNEKKNKYWGYEFNKNLDLVICKIERCRQNLKKEPLKVELVDLFNDEYKFCFKDEKGKVYGISNGGDCIFLTTLNKDGNTENHLYDFIDPILWDKANIYSIYLSSHDGIGYEKKHFDIPRIEMAYKLNSYMTIKEDILYNETINKNLNNIYDDIYNRENIEENFFKKYENEKDIKKLRNEYYKLLDKYMNYDIENEHNAMEDEMEEII